MPDDHFPDLLREIGETDATKMEGLYSITETLADEATGDQAARLIEIAHGHPVERDADEWFWRPFREIDASFPATNALPLHGRIADTCVRSRLAAGRHTDAMLVRLAALAGWDAITPLLHPAAEDTLRSFVRLAPPPAPRRSRAIWTASTQKKLEAELPEALDNAAFSTAAEVLAASVELSLVEIRARVDAVADWAASAYEQQQREQLLTQWLVTGIRTDGTPWPDLDAGTIAADAAIELADLLAGDPPELRHEQLLLLVLRASNVELDDQPGPAKSLHAADAEPTPEAVRSFTPVRTTLLDSGDTNGLTARDLGTRLLWESVTITAWSAA